MPDPFAIGAAAAGALVRVIGDTWTLALNFVQPNGSPIDLTGAAVCADLYIAGRVVATLAAAVAVPTSGRATLTIDTVLTAQAPELDPDFAAIFPTRLAGYVIDALGRRRTDLLVLYCPVSPAHARSLPAQDDEVTVVVGEQGPAGPPGASALSASSVITAILFG